MLVFHRYKYFVGKVFSQKFWLVHLLLILTTALLVFSGFDWMYLVFVQSHIPSLLLFAADLAGFLVPVVLIGTTVCLTFFKRKEVYRLYTQATFYTIILGLTLSSTLKAFTGRTSPPHRHHGEVLSLVDNSHQFNFGFFKENIIGGWPSSHATISFALATTFFILLPRKWYLTVGMFGTALFIGIGVTFGFHWLSEFIAGSLLGSIIGVVVGTHYKPLLSKRNKP